MTKPESLLERLVNRFSGVFDAHTRGLPSAIPFAAPVRKLAEAALDELAMGRGVPLIPAYDDELAAQRTWTGVRTSAELAEGLGFPHLEAVRRDGGVLLTATSAEGQVCQTRLPPNDAEEYALHVLSVVAAARAEGGIAFDTESRDIVDAHSAVSNDAHTANAAWRAQGPSDPATTVPTT